MDLNSKIKLTFHPRDTMLARVIVIATCPSVCPSVCLSVTGRMEDCSHSYGQLLVHTHCTATMKLRQLRYVFLTGQNPHSKENSAVS